MYTYLIRRVFSNIIMYLLQKLQVILHDFVFNSWCEVARHSQQEKVDAPDPG